MNEYPIDAYQLDQHFSKDQLLKRKQIDFNKYIFDEVDFLKYNVSELKRSPVTQEQINTAIHEVGFSTLVEQIAHSQVKVVLEKMAQLNQSFQVKTSVLEDKMNLINDENALLKQGLASILGTLKVSLLPDILKYDESDENRIILFGQRNGVWVEIFDIGEETLKLFYIKVGSYYHKMTIELGQEATDLIYLLTNTPKPEDNLPF